MELIRDLLTGMVSIAKGLWVTCTNWLARPRVTVQYPRQRRQPAPRYRGLFVLRPDPARPGGTRCTACGLCAQACPSQVIEIEPAGTGRERHPARYQMNLARCLFCRMCVEACPFEALAMTTEYEFTGYAREQMLVDLAWLAGPDRPAGLTHKELAAANPPAEGEGQ